MYVSETGAVRDTGVKQDTRFSRMLYGFQNSYFYE